MLNFSVLLPLTLKRNTEIQHNKKVTPGDSELNELLAADSIFNIILTLYNKDCIVN
jgi:hypothetical protein